MFREKMLNQCKHCICIFFTTILYLHVAAQTYIKDSIIMPTVADAFVYGPIPGPNGRNYGAATNLTIANPSAASAYKQIIFMKFDIHGIANRIHNGAIDSVKISPYVTSIAGSGSGNDSLKLFGTKGNTNNITPNSWIEGTLNGMASIDNSLTWLNMPDTTPLLTGLRFSLPTGTNALKQYFWFPNIANSAIWQNAVASNADSLVSVALFSSILPSPGVSIASRENGPGFTAHLVVYYHYVESTTPISMSGVSLIPDKETNNISIKWNTYSETSSSSFTVLKSKDGIHFSDIDSVAAAGNSSIQLSYQIVDKNPYAGINYYQVVEKDINGRLTYSDIVNTDFSPYTTQTVTLYPNPVIKGTILHLNILLAETTPIHIRLSDVNGHVIPTATIKFVAVAGENMTDFPIPPNLMMGNYWVSVYGKDNVRIKTANLFVK